MTNNNMAIPNIRLSVLDQSPVREGANAVEAVNETIEYARLCDQLGYTRFWVSEHHNIPLIAGSTPEVLMVKLAEVTRNLRIGAGGIMLPNHSSLKVAENFRMLEVLYPGRIDLGIGRAPGGDKITAQILNPSNDFQDASFKRQLKELNAFFQDTAETDYGPILAIPQVPTAPAQWMLTSGGSSALAGQWGMGLGVPRFINGNVKPEAVATYKENFKPSEKFPEPQAALGVFVVCAEDEEHARLLRKSIEIVLVSMDFGRLKHIMPPEKVKNYKFSDEEAARLPVHENRIVSGTPAQVKEELTQIAGDFGVDEFIVTTMTYHPEDKKRSFELLAEEFELKGKAIEFK